MDNISEHITYEEATHSDTATRYGLNNTPGPQELAAMKLTAEKVFEPLRTRIGKPIRVSSFYRSVRVNGLIGGSPTSQHCKGEAMDLQGIGMTNKELFQEVYHHSDYDQLIWEFGDNDNPAWVHVSYSAHGNRKEVLRAVHLNGRTVYQHFNP